MRPMLTVPELCFSALYAYVTNILWTMEFRGRLMTRDLISGVPDNGCKELLLVRVIPTVGVSSAYHKNERQIW